MAQEKIYTLIHRENGLRLPTGETTEEERAQFLSEEMHYVYDDGAWVNIDLGADEGIAIDEYMHNPDNQFAICFIPLSAITLDENNKIKKILLPGD